MQTNPVKLVGQSEYNMIVLDGQGSLHQIVNPEGLFCCLALWTMSVSTAVVAVA